MMLENLSREELIAQLQALHQQHNILQVEVQALRHQNDYYHQLFEHTGDAILLLDASDFRIVDINDNAARRWGYNREQLLAMNLEDVEVYDDTQGNVDFTLSSFSDTHIYEAQIKRADGSLIHVEVSSRPLVLDGRDYLQNHIRDITRRKQAEQANQQLINDLEAFTHTVAHDLKNPLQTVIGYGAMLQDMNWQTTDAEELETLTRYLHNVVAGSQKMSSIINELLQLAKIRAEDVQLTPVDMRPIIASAIKRLEAMPEFKTARIDLLTPDMPVALGHTGWVEEIWANLISNALKYGGQPAHIQIRGYALDDGQVCFEVQDNGQGISPEKMHLLFKQFERLDTERGIGHGLGLSIVASIIAKLGGTVSAESQVGQGSIFRLTLRAG